MQEKRAGSLRARLRAELTDEIKAVARRHLETDGANLSLRAIAREMGMVSSALYRYFASRDELLTALIIDAYDALGAAVEQADAAVTDRADVRARWFASGRALRTWAAAHPAEYALIYGSPVPGYVAPEDTVHPSVRPVLVLGRILADAWAAGPVPPASRPPMPTPVLADIEAVGAAVAPGVPPEIVARGLIAWTELFGAVSFELFGRFRNTIHDLGAWYDYQLRVTADFVGLPAAP